MQNFLTKTLSTLGLVIAATTASATPVVNWDYTVTSTFVTTTGSTTFNGAGPGNANGCELVSASSITWGGCPSGPAGAGRSGISITNSPESGTLTTNGNAESANTYTHNNNVVSSAYATLTSATISATLGLKVQGSSDPYTYQTVTYNILFAETPNTEGTCVAASPANNPCNDIWVLDGSLNNTINFDGNDYFFSFFASPALNALPDAVCAAVNASPNCIGFTTVEGQANQVDFLLKVTSTPLVVSDVPEPASITLLVAGLLSMVAVRRRRQNRA